jgi:hypothetical protein
MASDDVDPAAAPAPPRTRPGARGEQASRSDYLGCGLWALGFLVLVCVSFAVGVVLRPEDDPTVDLERVGPAGTDYVLQGSIDESLEPCVTLLEDGEEVTGQCGTALGTEERDEPGRYAFTSAELSDGSTLAFAPVPRAAETVVVTLADGSTVEGQVKADDELDEQIYWFAIVADQPVADGTTATLLDVNGNPVEG